MTEALKVLGQLAPLAATLTDLYVVPALSQAVVSSLFVANHGLAPVRFRVAVAVAGAGDAAAQYLYRDVLLGARSTFTATVGLTLGTGDAVRVQTDTATVSFSAFGSEVS